MASSDVAMVVDPLTIHKEEEEEEVVLDVVSGDDEEKHATKDDAEVVVTKREDTLSMNWRSGVKALGVSLLLVGVETLLNGSTPSWVIRRRRFAQRRGRRDGDAVDASEIPVMHSNVNWTENLVWAAHNLGDRPQGVSERRSSLPASAPSSGRHLGMGVLGRILGRQLHPSATEQRVGTQDSTSDFRPYFTYYVCIVHSLIFLTAALTSQWSRFGLGTVVSSPDELVFTERLTLERVDVVYQANFWLGLESLELIRLGAKFTPCMRPTDPQIHERILQRQRNESLHSGCCLRNDGSGCLQTLAHECSPLLSTFVKWSVDNPGPDNRVSGPVCGQDPRFCGIPASVGVNSWPDDVSKWPICRDNIRNNAQDRNYDYIDSNDDVPRHARCRPIGRPCCVGIHGRCELRSFDFCQRVNGHWHPEATLCSQVDCMRDVCGSGFFDSTHQLSRLISALFLHAGLLHLLLVLAFQILFLLDLERLCGTYRMAIIYFGSGITGNLASAIFVPYRAECGPSGALFGVMAAQVMEVYRARNLLVRPWLDALKIVLAILCLIIIGIVPWVDNYAHFFGLLQGLLLSYALIPSANDPDERYEEDREEGREVKKTPKVIELALAKKISALIFAIILFVVLMVVFYLGLFADCAVCRLLSCFPFTKDFCREQNIDYERKPFLF